MKNYGKKNSKSEPLVPIILFIFLGVMSIVRGKINKRYIIFGVICLAFAIVLICLYVRDKTKKSKDVSENKLTNETNVNNYIPDFRLIGSGFIEGVNFELGIGYTDGKFYARKESADSDDLVCQECSYNHKNNFNLLAYTECLGTYNDSKIFINYDNEMRKVNLLFVPKDSAMLVSTYPLPDALLVEKGIKEFKNYVLTNYSVEIDDNMLNSIKCSVHDCWYRYINSQISNNRNMEFKELVKEYLEFSRSSKFCFSSGNPWEDTTAVYIDRCTKELFVAKCHCTNTYSAIHDPYDILYEKPKKILDFAELWSLVVLAGKEQEYKDLNEENWQTYFVPKIKA